MKALKPISKMVDGHRKTVFIVNCRDCTNTLTYASVSVRAGKIGVKNPIGEIDQFNLKRLERQLDQAGWEHRRGATWALCPSCIALRHPASKDNVVAFPEPAPAPEPTPEVAKSDFEWLSLNEIRTLFDVDSYTANQIRAAAQRNWRQRSDGTREHCINVTRVLSMIDEYKARGARKRDYMAEYNAKHNAKHNATPKPLAATETPANQETAVNAAPTPITEKPVRVPTQGDRRQIMDALDKCYDVGEGRYNGTHTDEGIANALDMPRGWVTEVRQFAYGASGQNEMSDKKLQVMKAMEQKVLDLENQHRRLKQELEIQHNALAAMRRDLDAFRR
jgi:hypothetical protein